MHDYDYHVLDWIYPTVCGMCGRINSHGLCVKCEKILQKELQVKVDSYQENGESYLCEHIYIANYGGNIRQKMIAYKFQKQAYLHQFFSYILLKEKKICVLLKKYDIILPVPIHKKRKRKRGYNQSELIAREIARKSSNLTLDVKSLIKLKNTMAQSSLNKEERKKNIQGAYQIKSIEKIRGKKILLLDDVYTTGSTAQECARILQEEGQAKSVGVLTIAKD